MDPMKSLLSKVIAQEVHLESRTTNTESSKVNGVLFLQKNQSEAKCKKHGTRL
jgi:hypothetical protein